VIEAVLFDLANTLVNFHDLKIAAILMEGAQGTYAHLRQLGVAVPDFQRYRLAHERAFKQRYVWSAICGRDFNFMVVMSEVLRRYAIALPEGHYQTLAWMWYRPVVRHAYVEAGVAWAMEELRGRNIKLAIISNTCVPAHCMDQHLAREKLLPYFPIRIYSSTTCYRKPHRKIFEAALEQLGVTPERAAFVGDQLQTDIRGARRVGMATIWKTAAPEAKATRRHQADLVIHRIADLPGILTRL
jgi:putative hydrolase of the HAD superfamily